MFSAKSTLSELCLPALLIKQRKRDKNLQDTKFTKQRKRLKKKVGNKRDKKNKMLHSYPLPIVAFIVSMYSLPFDEPS